MGKRKLVLVAICALLILLAVRVKRFVYGYSEVLSELDLGEKGRAILVQKWENWSADGYGVVVWYQPETEGLWGVEVVEYSVEDRWKGGSLYFSQGTNEIHVRNSGGGVWAYNLGRNAKTYADSGFLFDPAWQPNR